MKKLFLVLLLLSSIAFAQVNEETSTNDYGQLFIRIHNTTDRYMSCYYKDNINYITFVINPYSITDWQPVYGYYEWRCQ